MQSLPEKVKSVRRVHARLDKEIASFQQRTRLHCLSGCGECCKKPDIEATPLEFLPLALKFFDEGKAEEVLEQLNYRTDPLCFVFRPNITQFGGLCSEYPDRGLICRLFGYTARRNKEGQKELVTCTLIKSDQKKEFNLAVEKIKSGEKVAVMSDYYSRLSSIDPTLVQFYPINEAMKRAVETVMHYYAYRKRRKRASQS